MDTVFISDCNSSSLCDNGFCMHNNWRCDGLNQCGDWSDEKYCNGTQPIPTTPAPPTPAPHTGGGSKGGKIAYLHIRHICQPKSVNILCPPTKGTYWF